MCKADKCCFGLYAVCVFEGVEMAARRMKVAVLTPSGPCAQAMSAEKQVRVQNVRIRGAMPRC